MSQPHPSHSPPSATSSGQLTPPRKPLACLPCRQRKIGCDRHQPQCASCQRAGLQCSFPPRTRTRRATKATKTEELAKRLNRLEQVLGDLDQTGQVRAETDYVEEPGQTGSDNSWLIHTLTPREDDIRPSTEPSTRVNSYLGRSVWKSLSAHVRKPIEAGCLYKLSNECTPDRRHTEAFRSSLGCGRRMLRFFQRLRGRHKQIRICLLVKHGSNAVFVITSEPPACNDPPGNIRPQRQPNGQAAACADFVQHSYGGRRKTSSSPTRVGTRSLVIFHLLCCDNQYKR